MDFAIPAEDREVFYVYQRMLQLVFQVAKGLIADPALYLQDKADQPTALDKSGEHIQQPRPGEPIAKLSAFGAVHYAAAVVYEAQLNARWPDTQDGNFLLERFTFWRAIRSAYFEAAKSARSKTYIDHGEALKVFNKAMNLVRNAVQECDEPVFA